MTVSHIWTIHDLDPNKLIDVQYSRDPETAVRFSIPVPNWLDDAGKPKPEFRHERIKEDKNGVWRFGFYNYEDFARQGVKIDGKSCVIVAGPTPNQAAKLRALILSIRPDVSQMTPGDLDRILEESFSEIGLHDRYNSNFKEIEDRMDAYAHPEEDHPYLGSFLYKEGLVSSGVFVTGNGEIDGAAQSAQRFEGGGFISFPWKRKEEAARLIRDYVSGKLEKKPDVKLISRKVFITSRRDLDGKPIFFDRVMQEAPLKRFQRPEPISGFPEWRPEIYAVEQEWRDTIRRTFELYGFTGIETPSVERMEILGAKGEDPEIRSLLYGIRPVQSEGENVKPSGDVKYGLHYDLTLPLARYVAMHCDKDNLAFPFKRYQMQKVWRGERPQKGRFREFMQCDIDVVDRGTLSQEFDAELPIIASDLMQKLGIKNVKIGVSNQKILEGLFQGLRIEDKDVRRVIRSLGKLRRDGEEGVIHDLSENIGLLPAAIDACISLIRIKQEKAGITDQAMKIGVDTPLLREGLSELDAVMERAAPLSKGAVQADLSIVRGFDYYTGTVYEGHLADYPDYPDILGGGRYDNLVGKFMDRAFPGVGISLGLTRIFSKLVEEGDVAPGRTTPTQVLVAISNDNVRPIARSIVDDFRQRGIPAEVYHEAAQLPNQVDYAKKKGIPFVIFPDVANENHLAENMKTQERWVVDPRLWSPEGVK